MSDLDRMLSDSLKGIRDQHVNQIETQIPAARRRIESKLRGRRFRFVVGGVAVAAAAVAAIVFVAQTVPKVDRSAPIQPAGAPVVLARIDVPQVGVMEPGFDRLWVSHEDGLVGIDPSTSAIDQDWPVRNVDGMAMNSEAMYTIDSENRQINRLGLGNNEAAFATDMEGTPTAIAASEEGVWVSAALGPVGDSQILAYTPLLEMPGGSASQVEHSVVADMIYAENALWMTTSVSPAKGTAEPNRSNDYGVHRFPGGESEETVWRLSTEEGSAADIVVGEGAAWILRHPTKNGGNTITRVDLTTDEVTERAVNFRESIESIAVGEGYLWVTTAPLGMNMPADAKATLHRIDPKTLQAVGEPLEVSGPGSKLAVGSGFVWVGDPNANQIVQIDPFGSTSPDPAPSTPEPEETEPPSDDEKCLAFLPFASSDGAMALRLGSGGQPEVSLEDQSPAALVHFAGPEGGYVDVVAGEPVWPPFDEEPIQVLGTRGTIHTIEDGYAVTFGLGGCDFQLIAYGLGQQEVKAFVDGLGLRGHLDFAYDAFTLWPETTPEAAYGACLDAAGSALEDPEATALAFAESALRWNEAALGEGLILNSKGGWRGYDVARDGSKDAPRVLVMVREVAAGCWHVLSVRTREEGAPLEGEAGLSVSSVDGKTQVAFDLEREAAGHPVDSVRLIVGPGEVLLYKEEFERKGFIELSDEPLEMPKALLVLLFDQNREVVGAIGQPLPSSDFSAG